MRIPLQVEYRDGSKQDCTAEYPDLCEFESRYNRSVLKLGAELRLSDLGFLAWHSLKRTNLVYAEYTDWSNTVSVVSATGGDDEQLAEEIVPLD